MATVTVNITGDANSFKQAMASASEKLDQFGAKAQAVGDRATNIGRSMTFGVTLPLIGIGKMAFDELSQSAAASAQTEAAIRSTGGAANVTAAQIDQLSSALLRKSGIDDETIKGGANVLLTFRAIRNEAGAGNDIFNQATKAALDLSVAFGKDMNSSAILVGKALQDPIQGLSALARVGVQFDEGQKQQIQSMVAAGDVMGAQKVILKELQTEVGGSAEAYGNSFAGKVSKAKEELKNASAAILSTAVPVMQRLADVALGAANFFAKLPGPVKEAAVVFGALAAVAGPLVYMFGAISTAASGAVSVIKAGASAYETLALKALYAVEAMKAMEVSQLALAGGMGFALVGIGAVLSALVLGAGAYEHAQEAAKGWANTTILAAKSTGSEYDFLRAKQTGLGAQIDQLKAQQKSYQDAVAAGRPGAQAHKNDIMDLEVQITNLQARHDALSPRVKELKQQMLEAKAAEEARKVAVHDLAAGTTDMTTATQEAKQAIYDLQSAVLAASGGELGLEQANLNLTKAQQDYTDALNAGDPSKITEAELALRQARLGVAQATLNAQDSQQKLLDIVNQGPDAVQAEIRKLKEAQAQYGDTSGAIQEQIDKLFWLNLSIRGLPDRKETTVYVAGTPEAEAALEALHAKLQEITGQPWQAVVQVTNQFDNMLGMPGQ